MRLTNDDMRARRHEGSGNRDSAAIMSNNDTSNNVPADTVSEQRKLEAID